DFMVNPVTNWALGEPAPPFADAARLPREMPAGASSYLLEPGALLYVPRGRLHEVASVAGADRGAGASRDLARPARTRGAGEPGEARGVPRQAPLPAPVKPRLRTHSI